MTIQEKIALANKLLLDGEPANISHDTFGGYTGYKPQYIIAAMNAALGYGGWGFKEIEMKVTDTLAICHLSVFIKEIETEPVAWGQSRITKGDVGDAMKGAQTDALKKALSYFDIGERAYFGQLEAPKNANSNSLAPAKDFHLTPDSSTAPKCADCNGPTKWSAKSGKWYCAAICWNKPKGELPTINVEDAPFPDSQN